MTLAQAVGGDPRRSGAGRGSRSRLLLLGFFRVLGVKSRPLFVIFHFGSICTPAAVYCSIFWVLRDPSYYSKKK
jgi:hypothetical protein